MALGIAPRLVVWLLVLSVVGTGVTVVDAAPDFSTPGSSDAQSATPQTSDQADTSLQYRSIVGLSLFAGAIASAALPLKAHATPPACRWCDGVRPNIVDRWTRQARWERPCRAAKLSYWSLGLASVVALGPMSHERRHREWLVNAGAAVDSVAATVMVTQLAKYAVRRERPRSNPCLAGNETETDRNLSFFSGHTSIAFAVVASARETARLRGRSGNDWLLAGSAAAALTGYFRVAGDRHYLTDVLAGAGVGIVVGTLVPRHLHRPKPGLAPSGLPPQAASAMTQPLVGITRPLESGGRRFLVHVGKGPGKSLQFGLSF